ncbi:MAG: CinA family protein [Robiginitomaculum sp.]|nr:CinA family protein [Robiginitomaculum sp.]
MPDSLEQKARKLVKTASERGITIGCAESCTGGWIGKCLTDVAGSSSVFMGSLVTYSNQSKLDILGIPPEILEFYGAVSEPVATAMALQARDLLHVDIAISVTGIAGPDGGTADKPIGTVCFGLVKKGEKPSSFTKQFGNFDREEIRRMTVETALDLFQKSLLI